jgi:LEA14-like dessication related protein
MRIGRITLVALLSIFLFTAISCGDIKEVEFGKIESARLLNTNIKELEAELSVRIKNANSFGFTVTKSDLNLSVNGKSLGKVKLKDNVHVKGNSDEPHTFTIKSDLSESGLGGLPALMSIIQSRSPRVKLEGYLKVRTFLFFSKKIPVDIEQSIPLGK